MIRKSMDRIQLAISLQFNIRPSRWSLAPPVNLLDSVSSRFATNPNLGLQSHSFVHLRYEVLHSTLPRVLLMFSWFDVLCDEVLTENVNFVDYLSFVCGMNDSSRNKSTLLLWTVMGL